MRRQRDATARASGRTVETRTGDARAGQRGFLLIGADADPEVGRHDGETDHHGDDQHILGSVTRPLFPRAAYGSLAARSVAGLS